MAIPVHAHNSFFGMPKFDVCFYFSIQYIKKYDKGPKTEVSKEGSDLKPTNTRPIC